MLFLWKISYMSFSPFYFFPIKESIVFEYQISVETFVLCAHEPEKVAFGVMSICLWMDVYRVRDWNTSKLDMGSSLDQTWSNSGPKLDQFWTEIGPIFYEKIGPGPMFMKIAV